MQIIGQFINNKTIADATEEMAVTAGRLMLERIHQLAQKRLDFAFETTGASRTFVPFLSDCKTWTTPELVDRKIRVIC